MTHDPAVRAAPSALDEALLAYRLCVEPEAAALAAAHRAAEDLHRLERCVARIDRLHETEERDAAVFDFHLNVAIASGSLYLAAAVAGLRRHVRSAAPIGAGGPRSPYAQILQQLRRGDGAAARSAMHDHLRAEGMTRKGGA